MKSNIAPPCFTKTVSFNGDEYRMILKCMAYVEQTVTSLTETEVRVMIDIVDKMKTPAHPQNN